MNYITKIAEHSGQIAGPPDFPESWAQPVYKRMRGDGVRRFAIAFLFKMIRNLLFRSYRPEYSGQIAGPPVSLESWIAERGNVVNVVKRKILDSAD